MKVYYVVTVRSMKEKSEQLKERIDEMVKSGKCKSRNGFIVQAIQEKLEREQG